MRRYPCAFRWQPCETCLLLGCVEMIMIETPVFFIPPEPSRISARKSCEGNRSCRCLGMSHDQKPSIARPSHGWWGRGGSERRDPTPQPVASCSVVRLVLALEGARGAGEVLSHVGLVGGACGAVGSAGGVHAVVDGVVTLLRQDLSAGELCGGLLLDGSLLLDVGLDLCVFGALLDGPVKDVVVLEALADEEVAEELTEVRVVGLVVEAERTAAVEIDGHLRGEAAAEELGGGGHLLLHDAVVLLLLGGGLETLPRERAAEEVHEDVAQRLEVVTSRLLDTEVGVDRGVAGGAGEVLVLSVGDVEVGLGVAVLLGETKVDDIDLVATLTDAHEEVVGLDVTVDEVSRVDVLDSRDLQGWRGVRGRRVRSEEKDGLEGELSVAEVEEVLEGRAEEVDDHGVVVALLAVPADEGDADTACEGLVDLGLILELRVLGLDGLELDGDLLTGDDVDAEVDVTE
ncbi:hypothetical protein L1887_48023 [Cichorium endivia]|nr:hypothetical protein L1887_48023 [Cichorium endivia]